MGERPIDVRCKFANTGSETPVSNLFIICAIGRGRKVSVIHETRVSESASPCDMRS